MEESRRPLKEAVSFFYQHWASILTLCYPILVIMDTFSLPSPERIYQGQPFFYSWYLNSLPRTQILIVVGLILFCFLLLRIFWPKIRWSRSVLPAVFFGISLLIVFVLALTPAINVGWHIATTPVYNQTQYNLYARPLFNPPSAYEFVLIECDSLGLLCQFAERWEAESNFFDASNYSLRLDTFNHTLQATSYGRVVYTHPLE